MLPTGSVLTRASPVYFPRKKFVTQGNQSLHPQLRGSRLIAHHVQPAQLWGCLQPSTATWMQMGFLMLLQQRCFFRVWKRPLNKIRNRLRRKKIRLTSAEDVSAVQVELKNGVLNSDVPLASSVLRAGTEILTSEEALSNPALPLTLEFSKQKADHPRGILRNIVCIIGLAEGPVLLLGWGRIIIHWSIKLGCFLGSKQQFSILCELCSICSTIITQTCCAFYAHRIIGWWRDQRSRGRATVTDVLGSQSSMKEAQINALKTFLQVVVWSLYLCSVLWAGGIELGRVLLFPSITAVVIGWVGREVVANIISGLILHLTQPFAQGDWVTLEDGSIDGWVQDISTFYTRVIQWDKRPVYVPNSKLMAMNVQNNSRMTHRRVLFDLPLRLSDIPKIPKIVADIQDMIQNHEDIDNVQHRLVRWRSVGDWSANIWVSCYTQPTVEGIRLNTFTAVQQSVLERCSAIIYKHNADFASATDRYARNAQERNSDGGWKTLFDSFSFKGIAAGFSRASSSSARERNQGSRT